MKIAILTFSKTPSYGASLQCYALCRKIQEYGYNPFLVNLRLPTERSIKYRLRELISLRNFITFRNKWLPPFVNSMKGLDCLIIGSDQVWNPDITRELSLCYWGKGIESTTKVFSYASSFGTSEWSHKELNSQIIKLFRNFSGISIREEDGIDLCKKNFGVNPIVVLDPTLLFKGFDEFIIKGVNTQDNIVSFKLHKPFEVKWYDFIDKISHEMNLEVVHLNRTKNKRLYDVISVEQWYTSIAKSKFVITDSFHGMVMAILSHKNFVVFESVKGRSNRITNLLNQLSLRERYLGDFSHVNIANVVALLSTPINYSVVDNLLSEMRMKSESFLKSQILKI